jgi:pimeloyl-ACP methyl ester carboxylesterase
LPKTRRSKSRIENELLMQRFDTPDGLTLVTDVGGHPDASAVVLLHGGGQTRHSWAGAMRHLIERGYFVISYDARGHGDSDWSPLGDYSLTAMASDLRAVISTLSRPVALVGASMGGMTSFYTIASADHPTANALVMVDIALRPAPAGVRKIRQFMSAHHEGFATLDEAAEAVTAYNPARRAPSDPSGLMKNLRLREDGRLHWHWDPRLMDQRPTPEPPASTAELELMANKVTVPTLLVRGGQSDIVDDESVAQMRKLVPQTEVFEVPGAGHMVAGDRNDAFNEGVFAFLARYHPVRGSI